MACIHELLEIVVVFPHELWDNLNESNGGKLFCAVFSSFILLVFSACVLSSLAVLSDHYNDGRMDE